MGNPGRAKLLMTFLTSRLGRSLALPKAGSDGARPPESRLGQSLDLPANRIGRLHRDRHRSPEGPAAVAWVGSPRTNRTPAVRKLDHRGNTTFFPLRSSASSFLNGES